MEHIFASMESTLLGTPASKTVRNNRASEYCAPSWARRARARPAPQTSASQTSGPDDYSRTVGHGHGHVYGHARAIPI